MFESEPVQLQATIQAPPGSGVIVSSEWDYDGSGAYGDTDTFTDRSAKQNVRRTHAFSKPGTHFVTLRVTLQREGAVGTPFARVHNLARARVVVS